MLRNPKIKLIGEILTGLALLAGTLLIILKGYWFIIVIVSVAMPLFLWFLKWKDQP